MAANASGRRGTPGPTNTPGESHEGSGTAPRPRELRLPGDYVLREIQRRQLWRQHSMPTRPDPTRVTPEQE